MRTLHTMLSTWKHVDWTACISIPRTGEGSHDVRLSDLVCLRPYFCLLRHTVRYIDSSCTIVNYFIRSILNG